MTQTGSGTGTAATAGDISSAVALLIPKLRRMTAEPGTTTYSDAELAACIERYALVDVNGESPTIVIEDLEMFAADREGDYEVGEVGEATANPDWIATYDLNAAAAAIWTEKAGLLAGNFDFQADGASYSRSQGYQQAMAQSRYYASRRAIKTVTQSSGMLRRMRRQETVDDDASNG